MGNVAEPDTRRFPTYDIYTHIAFGVLDMEEEQTVNNYTEPQDNVIHLHDTIYSSNSIIILDSLNTNMTKEQYQKNDSSIWVTAVLHAYDMDKKVHRAYPKYHLIKDRIEPVSDSIPELGIRLTFWKINPENGSIEIMLSERKTNQKDFIVMQAYMFPYINILWLGCVLMVLGTGLAVRERIRVESRFKV
jgi:cytochrome c-type biogenesis protein CcmF